MLKFPKMSKKCRFWPAGPLKSSKSVGLKKFSQKIYFIIKFAPWYGGSVGEVSARWYYCISN